MSQPTPDMFELVREVRHDLNGPLAAALGNVQLLLEDPRITDVETREVLGDIEADRDDDPAPFRRASPGRRLTRVA